MNCKYIHTRRSRGPPFTHEDPIAMGGSLTLFGLSLTPSHSSEPLPTRRDDQVAVSSGHARTMLRWVLLI
jgi:hypothetical protein